jgi:hypothetical protein
MVPSVKHLHGEPVALSDPSDQDIVRSRLCRTQWPSRKVGRIGLAGGSMETARFLKLSQVRDFICDLPHSRRRERRIGIIVQKTFFTRPSRCRPYQRFAGKAALAYRFHTNPSFPARPDRLPVPGSR